MKNATKGAAVTENTPTPALPQDPAVQHRQMPGGLMKGQFNVQQKMLLLYQQSPSRDCHAPTQALLFLTHYKMVFTATTTQKTGERIAVHLNAC
jgi:hypothetical protein